MNGPVGGRRLEGRAVIVAGGSGGLGSDVARHVARQGGIPVIGFLRDAERAERLASEIGDWAGFVPPLVHGDVLEESVRRRLIEAATSAGSLYGLVSLVGAPARVRLETATQEDLVASMRVNYVAPLLVARDFAASFEGRDASIVFVSTMQATGVFSDSTLYAAPKAALVHAVRILARQWGGDRGIRVNVIAPGVTTSGMAAASVRSGKYDGFIERGTITRFGEAVDIARAIGLFLEPDNYITGQILTVDGGLTTRM